MRVSIVGTSGSGKSTLGRKLEEQLGLKHVELDQLFFSANWTPRPENEFVGDLNQSLAGDCWVASGNYSKFRPLILTRATHIVWLNYPAWRVGHQLLVRSLHRAWTGEEMYNGCVETCRQSFASKDSILLFAAQTFHKNRNQYRALFDSNEYPHLERVELQSRAQANRWLSNLTGVRSVDFSPPDS